MEPISIITVLTEGYLYFRRFLAVASTAKSALEGIELLNPKFDAELRNHREVEGDPVYLIILGYASLKSYLISKGVEDKKIWEIMAYAVASSRVKRSSNDVRTVMYDYAYTLGATMQTIYKTFEADVSTQLSKGTAADSMDPVFAYLKSNPKPPQELGDIVEVLLPGGRSVYAALADSVNKKGIVSDWVSAITSPSAHVMRGETFQGVMLIGARSVAAEPPVAIGVMSGPDAVALSTAFVNKATTPFQRRATYPEIRSITSENTKAMTRDIMESRGFVSVKGGGYYRREDVVPRDPNDKKAAPEWEPKTKRDPLSGVKDKVTQTIQSKLWKLVTSATEKMITKKFKK